MGSLDAAELLLSQARALREAFPDRAGLPVADAPDGGGEMETALRYLRDEMLLVRDGKGSLSVLDDEAALVRRLLAEQGCWQARHPVST